MKKLRLIGRNDSFALECPLLKRYLMIALGILVVLQVSAKDNSGDFPRHRENRPRNNMTRDIMVSGRITNTENEPLSGVTVLIKGTETGTTSGADGRYSLSVPENAVLTFSYVGYAFQEVQVNGRNSIDVRLEASDAALGEVVVVGYGTQKKINLTGAVSQIKGEDLTKRNTSNIQQALQGQAPGMTIIDRGAAPGVANMVMRIRGVTTLGANEPLVIVDGIEQRLVDINPLDIASISILKDASSTAIYGSRAANGVILVTTKRAKSGKVSVTYNGSYALQKSNNNPEHMGLEDYMRLQNVAWTNSTGSPIYTEEYIQEYIHATDRLKYPLPNVWYDEVLRTAPQIDNAISLSGGNETIKTRLSVRHRDQQGIIIANSESKTSELRLNTDYKVSSKINVSADINFRHTNTIRPINENAVFNYMLQTSQWAVPRYPDGTYGTSAEGNNPLINAEIAGQYRMRDDYLFGAFKAEWEILKGLKLSSQLGGVHSTTNGKHHSNSYEIRDYYNPDIIRKQNPINYLNELRDDYREYTINNLLTYSHTFGDHELNALAGYSQISNKSATLNAYRQDFYNNEIQSISQGANDATKSNSGGESEFGLRSYFSRLNYSYKGKYLLEANARYDGSSRFLEGNRYSFFPSVSAGWRISEEDFWQGMENVVNDLKLRGSWGQTGNQAVALYSGYATLNLSTYSIDGMPVQGFRQASLASQDLTWETTTQSDIGIDALFLNNRISLTVDYYYKKTNGILLTLPVPATLGLLASPVNAGRVDNKGWEFLLGYHDNFGQFGLNITANLNINDNKVMDLAGTGPYISGGIEDRNIITVGYPMNMLWGYKTDGLFQTQDEVDNYPTRQAGIAPGDIKYVDLNEDGKLTPDDMTFLGRTFPRYTFGSVFGLSYKAFSLNLLFQGVGGVKTRIGGAINQMGIWGGFTHKLVTGNYWTPENRDARFPRPLKFDIRNDEVEDRSLRDGTYLRLKNIQLMYEVPSALTSKIKIDRLSVYVAATNLLTFANLNEWDVDPETILGGRTEVYPQTSLYTFGVNVQF